MIIVAGSVVAGQGNRARLIEISLAHVRRSRGEAGCLEHGVAVDAENADRLVFFERWRDREALLAHFALAASREFAAEATRLAAAPPVLRIYGAEEISASKA